MTDKRARWVIPLIAAIIVLVISSIFLVVDAQAPALRVNGSSAVNPGETLHVHGTGFLPGGWVTLKLEDGEVLSPNSGLGQTEHNTGSGVEAANALQMLAAGQLSQETASNSAILVNNVGAFDTNIVVREDWGLGPHTIHATEEGARSADLQFTITAKSARLVVNSKTLDFGSIHQGKKVFLAEMLGNTGGQRLTWTADSKGTTWLTPQPHMGVIQPGSLQQPLYVAADTSNLQAGNYTATLRLSSNGGEMQLAVKLTVIAGGGQQVRLKVIPGSLDFGMQTKGAQTTLQAVVSNLGTQVLNWKVSAGNTKWLALDKHAGTIEPGGLPQTIYITADTSKLSPRTYPAALQFSSNGGSVKLGVKIVVTLPPPIPPSPNPVPIAPKLKVSPSSLDGNNNCSYAQGQGWTCVTMLSNRQDATSSLNWSASASGIPGITFYPASGVLPPGQFVQVNALIPETTCPASATFTFMGPASTIPVSWRCSPIPPTLTLSPLSFSASTDCSFGAFGRNSGWTCLATLISSGNKSNINWTASASGLPGIAFLPARGTLAPGAPALVTIIVPYTACPASATFTFSGAAKAVTIPWSCAASKLDISPERLTNGCLSCTVTLALDANSPGKLDWKASAFGLSGITFRPSQGTLSPGKSVQVIISVPNTTCPASATFTFSGAANSFNVPWYCAPGESQLTVSPTTLIAGSSDCPSSDNGWTCTAILAPSAGSQSAINWSASSNLRKAVFSSSGTLLPGRQTQVTIFIPKSACHMSSFSFAGPANAISVPWSCAKPPRLRLGSSNRIDANRDCTGGQGQVWNCSFALTGDPDNQSGANWSASSNPSQAFFSPSSGIQTSLLSSYDNSSGPNVFFSPSSGTVAPGQTEVVNITFSANCPNQTDLAFTELDTGDTSLVPWSCTSPPAITASPGSFTANSSICPAGNGGWTCTTTLSASGSASSLNWSASSSLPGAIFTPSSGMLATGQSGQQVSIFIPSGDCQNGTFSFMGPANTVISQWSCTPPPKLEASLGTCSYTAGQGWSCPATVTSDPNNQIPLDWSAPSNSGGITFNPPGGTLNPGQQVQVAIAIPDAVCPTSNTFTFSSSTEGATPASITWTCVAPSMMVSSGGTCPDNGSGAYTCTMTLSLDNGSQGDLNWSVSGPSGVTFDHSSGKLVPGAQQQVTASVPASDCSVGSFTFTDNAGNIYTSTWSCATATATPTPTSTATSIATDTATPTTGTTVTPTDTPTATATTGTPTGTPTGSPTATPTPTIQVSPTSFDSSTCTSNSDGSWTCTATLSLVSGVSSNVNWTATSTDLSSVTFNPASSTLTPGQTESVAITVPATDCTSGTFTFTPDTGSPTTAPWTCSGTPTPTATNTPTPTTGVTPTDTPTPGVTPTDTPTPGVTPTDTPTPTPTPGVTPTDTPTPTPGVTPTDTPTPTPGVTPTDTPTPTPGITPTPTSTSTAAATPNRPKPSYAWTPTPVDRPALIHRHRFLDAYFDG